MKVASDVIHTSLTGRVPESFEDVHVARGWQRNGKEKGRSDHEVKAPSQLNKWTLDSG